MVYIYMCNAIRFPQAKLNASTWPFHVPKWNHPIHFSFSTAQSDLSMITLSCPSGTVFDTVTSAAYFNSACAAANPSIVATSVTNYCRGVKDCYFYNSANALNQGVDPCFGKPKTTSLTWTCGERTILSFDQPVLCYLYLILGFLIINLMSKPNYWRIKEINPIEL